MPQQPANPPEAQQDPRGSSRSHGQNDQRHTARQPASGPGRIVSLEDGDERMELAPDAVSVGRRAVRGPRIDGRRTAEASPPAESIPGRQPAAAATRRPREQSPAKPEVTSARSAAAAKAGDRPASRTPPRSETARWKSRVKQDEADAIEPHPHGELPVEVKPWKTHKSAQTRRAAPIVLTAPTAAFNRETVAA